MKRVTERTISLAETPSPTNDESRAAELVQHWWRDDGLSEISTDEFGNVWASSGGNTAPVIGVAAHIDTVFPLDVPLTTRVEGRRLIGPSVGDNSVSVAALSSLAWLVHEIEPACALALIATTGEEGLGNLRGVTGALKPPSRQLDALIAVEGNYLDRIGNVAVGSLRFRVAISGPGGHAWEDSQSLNAVHLAAQIVSAISLIPTQPGVRSVNVGIISGGEAVNARAQRAQFVIDLRAVEPGELLALERLCRAAIDEAADDRAEIDVQEIGRRPGGRLSEDHLLARCAVDAAARFARPAAFMASSTDANAAHAMDVAALALGITTGRGEHTSEEWIDLDLIGVGLCILATTIVDYWREAQ
ncbi:MAG: M20/M25/M40 family metallo-hydrolase [Acidimicrobiales bacterium]